MKEPLRLIEVDDDAILQECLRQIQKLLPRHCSLVVMRRGLRLEKLEPGMDAIGDPHDMLADSPYWDVVANAMTFERSTYEKMDSE